VSEPQVPLLEVPAEAQQRLLELGAPANAYQSKLYQALANEPDLLLGWVELAWRLRADRHTSVRLRELMILRAVQLGDCDFEIVGHQIRARAEGVTDEELAQVADWRSSAAFAPQERLALELAEEVVAGPVSDQLNARLAETFSAGEQVELLLTAAFYCMVPRVIESLRLVRDA
jgi:AhpD family alkylhydroperoxidase